MNDNVYASKHTNVYASKQDEQELTVDLTSLTQETTTISFRIPVTHKVLYKKMTTVQKAMFRAAVVKLLESIAKNRSDATGPVIINMNVNMNNNLLDNKVNNKNNVIVKNNSLSQLKDILELIIKIANEKSRLLGPYNGQSYKIISDHARRALKLLREVN